MLRSIVVALLQSALIEATSVEDRWPIRPDEWLENSRGDATMMRFCSLLDVDEIDWGRLVYKAEKGNRAFRFRELTVKRTDELQAKEILFAPDLEQIAQEG